MSFRLKTILGIALIESVLLLILVISGLSFLSDSNDEQLQRHAAITSRLFANATKDAVLSTDLATLESFIDEIMSNPDIVYTRISNLTTVLAEGGETGSLNQLHSPDHTLADVTDGVFDVRVDIIEGDTLYGTIEMGLSTSAIENILADAKRWAAAIAGLEIFLVAIFSFILGTYLTRQLQRLKIATETITEHGPGHQIEIVGNDEIASVTHAFNKMSISLHKNYTEIKNSLFAQKQALALSNGTQAKYKAILSTSLDALITINASGEVIDYNDVAVDIFGWSREEISGQRLEDFIIPADLRDAHNHGVKNYLNTDNSTVLGKRRQLNAQHKDGHIFPIEITLSSIKTDRGTLFTAFIRDISERLAAETKLIEAQNNAEMASEAKSNFLATMSHEIRTPMNAILGVLGLLKDTPLDNKQIKWIQTGRASGEMLLTIINNILDFSKMEADKLELEHTSFKLRQLLEQTIEILEPQATDKGLTIELTLPSEIPECVVGDPGRLRQVLINLINNAIKFSTGGTIKINGTVEEKDNKTLTFYCAVQDEGIGIPKDKQKTLFDRFTMVDQSYARSHEGTGLGLAICKRLVNLMHGDITFSSDIDVGSTFLFGVELGIAEQNNCKNAPLVDKPQQLPAPGTRILLAEDNPANQMVMKHILERSGLQVDIVANGKEAVETVSNMPYDIILMDISMPMMNGMDATREIRQLPGPVSKIPIVALTAHALSSDKKRFLEAGMNDYLGKPSDRSDILECIARWTEGKISATPQVNSSISNSSNNNNEYVNELVLQQLVDDTAPEIVPELLINYINDTQKRMQQIQLSITEGNFKTLEFECHTIGSSAAAHGNNKLCTLARKIENLCQNNHFEQALSHAYSLADISNISFLALKKRAEQGFETTE